MLFFLVELSIELSNDFIENWKRLFDFVAIFKEAGYYEYWIETAKYIISHYENFLTQENQLNLKYSYSSFRLTKENIDDIEKIIRAYKNLGWLTDRKITTNTLENYENRSTTNVAIKIILGHTDGVFLNLCPRCNNLLEPHMRYNAIVAMKGINRTP